MFQTWADADPGSKTSGDPIHGKPPKASHGKPRHTTMAHADPITRLDSNPRKKIEKSNPTKIVFKTVGYKGIIPTISPKKPTKIVIMLASILFGVQPARCFNDGQTPTSAAALVIWDAGLPWSLTSTALKSTWRPQWLKIRTFHGDSKGQTPIIFKGNPKGSALLDLPKWYSWRQVWNFGPYTEIVEIYWNVQPIKCPMIFSTWTFQQFETLETNRLMDAASLDHFYIAKADWTPRFRYFSHNHHVRWRD